MQNTNKVQKIFKKKTKKKQGLFCMLPFIIFPQNNSTPLRGECVMRGLQTSKRSLMISQVPV